MEEGFDARDVCLSSIKEMKIASLQIENYPPIKNLKIEDLGDVVIIAGANGSGKTRLMGALVRTFQGSPQMTLVLESTRKKEEESFKGRTIEVIQGQQNPTFDTYMSGRKFGRGRYVGSLVQIDSQRNIQTTQYNQVSWQVADPDDQETPSTFYYEPFTNRWQNFMDYIHQKVAAHDRNLAEEVRNNPAATGAEYMKKYPHPLEKYKDIFRQLLPSKELQAIDPASPGEFKFKDTNDSILPFNSLSSGEQEVVKVIFDVATKDIKHSVIVVDEPELHLHPTLAFKLVETLKAIGDHTNQFIFLTHSADLISTYYSTGNVYFIDAEQSGANQAHRLSELNRSHKEVVKLVGENLGLFAVGKKLVFVEGEDSSIDRLTYHAIAQEILPEAKIISVGSVANIETLNSFEQQIRESIFGIDLYMVRDRDGLSSGQIQALEESGKIRCLGKRHIENYFLDAEVLFKVAEKLYLTTLNTALSKEFIEVKIKEIAIETLGYNLLQNTKEYLELNHHFKIPTVKGLDQKTLDEIKDGIISGVVDSLEQLSSDLSESALGDWINEEGKRLKNSLASAEWVNIFHGKLIFSRLCGEVLNENLLKIRQAYVDIAIKEKPEVFDEIKTIFESFK